MVLLQQRYANGKTIYNSLQTNGALITEEWAAFFAQHHFLSSISIDGSQVEHCFLVEQNGDVFSSDYFVFPAYKMGNLRQYTLEEIAVSPLSAAIWQAKANLSSRCQNCAWRFACHGGSPKHRICMDNGERQNYLCKGYLEFFQHVTPYMNVMRQLLLKHRFAAHITRIVDMIADDVRQ